MIYKIIEWRTRATFNHFFMDYTPSLVVFQERGVDGCVIRYVVIYEKYFGSPEWMGSKLVSFLNNIRIFDDSHADTRGIANGMGCLVAQYIAENKDGPEGVYIENCNRSLDEKFNYVVTYDRKSKEFFINVNNGENKKVDEFLKCLKQ